MGRGPTTSTWDGAAPGRARVLVECPPEHSPSVVSGVLERQGFEVRVCEGPDRRHPCPLVEQGSCSLVSGADVVVNLLGSGSGAREVLGAITDERRPPAVVTEVSDPERRRREAADDWWFHRDRVHLVQAPITSGSLLDAVGEALRQRDRPVPVWGDGFC